MRRSRVAILYNFAHAYALVGQWDEALTAAEQSVASAHALRAENNSDVRIQLELSRALDNLGYTRFTPRSENWRGGLHESCL